MRDRFPNPYTLEHADEFIGKISAMEPTQVFAIEINGEVVGSVGVFPQEDVDKLSAEVGYWLAEEFWGKGIATKALKHIIDYGFNTFQVVTRIYAIPFPLNIASQKVIEKNGMVLEAVIKDSMIKNGVIMDKRIYAIRREKWAEQLSK